TKLTPGKRAVARRMAWAERSNPTMWLAPSKRAKPQKKPSLQPTSRNDFPARGGRRRALNLSREFEPPFTSGKDWYCMLWGRGVRASEGSGYYTKSFSL